MKQTKIRDLAYIAVFTAIIAVLAQISIPMPGGVPFTLQTLAVPLAGVVLGPKRGTLSALLYILLGFVGVPVFTGFTGGPGHILGVTGGFIIAFPLMALLAGWGILYYDRQNGRARGWIVLYASLIAATLVAYLIGMIWFSVSTKGSMAEAFALCVLPFIVTDIVKIAVTGGLGVLLRRTLIKAHILEI